MTTVLDFRLHASGQDPAHFSQQMGAACRGLGLFHLTEHGIPARLLADVLDRSARFFALPEEEKARLDIRQSQANRGWAGPGVELRGGRYGRPMTKESYSIGLDLRSDDPRVRAGEPFRGSNLWPEDDLFRDVMRDYYKEMLGLGRGLMRAVERDLDLPQGFFQPHFTEPMATLRLSYYPADPWFAEAQGDDPPQFDYGALTLVLGDGRGGLQVQTSSGQWIDVPEVPGSLIVMVGDGLMRWSNDQYRAVPHRLRSPARPRHVAAFYLDPNPDSLIAPLPGTGAAQYAPIRAAEYLRARLDETYLPMAQSR
ncbi:isopenicillin N synthase family dioxygenase [Celeribacter neptunius]|nr:2-oxoglutarate and iron-dependent oxygenase domain-containing protein [Celeribacter neptunius]